MPTKPLHACNAQRCPNLTDQRFCPAHAVDDRRRAEAQRPSASERGYGRKWQQARVGYLARHPLCVECLRAKRVTAATNLDHITPHRGDMGLFWSSDNWQSLCSTHHSEKTAREDGGFGNRRQTA